MCQIAPFLIFSNGARSWTHIANVQLYYHSLFYSGSYSGSCKHQKRCGLLLLRLLYIFLNTIYKKNFKKLKKNFFLNSLFYNKLNSMKPSFSNTSELTKLHHLSNFLGGRCPEFPYKACSCKIIIFLSIFM